MSMRIIYSVDNLSRLYSIDKKAVKHLTKLGLIPKIEGRSPIGYDKEEIDAWVASGCLDRLRNLANRKRKGRY